MLKWSYALGLLFAISGILLLDWHGKLAFWYDKKRTILTVASAMMIFIIWDLLGIHFNIFFNENSPYTLSILLFPNFPVEELLFLFIICYMPLTIYRGVQRGYHHLPFIKR